MVNVHVCNIGISSIHGKELPGQSSFHHKYERSHIETNVRHIWKISVRARWDLWTGNNWLGKSFLGKMSLIGDERVINLQRTKVYVFSDSVLCLGKIIEIPQSNDAWDQRLGWFKSSQVHRSFDRSDGEPMEFEWNIFPGFKTLQLSEEVKSLLLKLGETPENSTGRIFSCRCSTTSPVHQETMKKNACQMTISFLYMQIDLEQDNGHLLLDLVLKRSGILSVKIVHKENRTIWRKGWCWNSQKADIQFSVLQVHCPEVSSKAKAMENCRYTIAPIWRRFKLFFAQYFCVLEIATCCLHGKYGVEIRISSVNRERTHSWARISHGSSLWWIWTTMSREPQKCSSKNMRWNWMRRILHADQRPAQNHEEENLPALHQEQFLLGTGLGPMLNQGIFTLWFWHIEEIDSSSSSCKTTKKRRRSDRILEIQRRSSEIFPALSSLVWRQVEENPGRRRKQEKPTLQYTVVIPSNFFQYIYHVGCAINLHSIINSGLILGGQILNNRQTVFFLLVDPMDKNDKDLDTIDLNKPRRAQKTCITHGRDIRTQCIGSTSILLWGKDWSSIRLDRTKSFFTKHFQLIVFRK